MEKEVLIAIIGALAVIGGAVIQSGILDKVLDFEGGGGGSDLTEDRKYPPMLISLEPDEEGPQEVGSVIRWTAIATDPDGGHLDYKFSVKRSSTNDAWVIGKDWSTQNWWDWTPSEAGSYDVQVEVMDGDHSGPEDNDDFWIKWYVIGEWAGADEAERSREPPVLTSLEPDKPSPQEIGAAIKWVARADDPDDKYLYYRFLLKGPSTGGSWDAVQDWSTQSWWEWIPSEAGSYQLQVDVRDGDHSGSEGRDDFRIGGYIIGGVTGIDEPERSEDVAHPPTLIGLEPDKSGPQESGSVIRWTARAEDPDDESLYYRFLLKGPSTGGSWDAVQDWSTQNWWEWSPSEAGSYDVQVDVRDGDHAGPEGRDDSRIKSYVIEEETDSDEGVVSVKPTPVYYVDPDVVAKKSSLDKSMISTQPTSLYTRVT